MATKNNPGISSRWGCGSGTRPSMVSLRRLWSALPLLVFLLVGCGGPAGSGGTGSGSQSTQSTGSLSGNWEFQVTPTNPPNPFTGLAGFINEQGQTASDFVTASLQATPQGCYTNAQLIPMDGVAQGAAVNLGSFSVNGQILTINAQRDATSTHLTGKYSIAGGCADGATGTLTAQRYAPVKGTYTGTILGGGSGQSMHLTLAQSSDGSGDGSFSVSGSGAFTGIRCFTSGSLAARNGTVIGSSIHLAITTNDASGATATLSGNIDAAADTLTFASIEVSGGACTGSLGSATLRLQ